MSLSERQERAAQLIAAGDQSDKDVAAALQVHQRTIIRWRQDNEFATRVGFIKSEIAASAIAQGVADRSERVAALNDRWQRMQRVIDERAEDPMMAGVAGGSTGLLVHSFKMIGGGRDATTVDEYAVDVGLLKELRAHEEQAAKELGQWVEKTRGELTGRDGGPIQVQDVSKLDDDELDALIAELAATDQAIASASLARASAPPASMDAPGWPANSGV